MDSIKIRGAREHNLKNISLEIPRGKLVVFTGVSGSGKSSLAFDTIFAEGQRRYVESLSSYARQFLAKMDKPDVDEIEGLSPAISIDQKTISHNPRSTVATATEIYDYLRVLFARVGIPYCVQCGRKIQKMTVQEILNLIQERIFLRGFNPAAGSNPQKKFQSVVILAPVVRARKGEYYQMLYNFYNKGFDQVRIDGKFHKLSEQIILSRYKQHTIELLIDRITPSLISPLERGRQDGVSHASHEEKLRLQEAVEQALHRAQGLVTVVYEQGKTSPPLSPSKGEGGKGEADHEETFSSSFACPADGFSFPEIEPRLFSFNSPQGACPQCHGLGLADFWGEKPCPVCNGTRLRPEALAIKIGGKNIAEVCAFTIDEAFGFLNSLGGSNPDTGLDHQNEPVSLHGAAAKIAEPVLKEINNRLKFLREVGLDYLTLERKMGTLAGGEAQRIRLASQLGSRLTGTLYVLDEPTIGLHPADNDKLLTTLLELRDLQNTVIVVEHDRGTIEISDYLVDLGPGAGHQGGEVVAAGVTRELIAQAAEQSHELRRKNNESRNKKFSRNSSFVIRDSLTLDYLTGRREIPLPSERRVNSRERLRIVGAKHNNLQNLVIDIPLRRFICLTGISGSGKSTLLYDVLCQTLTSKLSGIERGQETCKDILGSEYIGRVLVIDQSPIGRTPRSNPATYVGFWAGIRDLFAMTEEARKRGYASSRFSFNVKSISAGGRGGRCEACEGYGLKAIEMHFLPTVWVTCDVCHGKRFDAETLEVLYKAKNIYEVLKMTISEAREFFSEIYYIADKLKVLEQVGLGYLELGQTAPTLSGGEAQRIKLGAELAMPSRARTLYLFDEPTVGLHFEDVKNLLLILQRLVDTGSTVMVIEHNLDVIKCADYIIDLGPGGGKFGGRVVATGTPEEVMKNKESLTGKYLKSVLK
jgi:excinuclease ABC subunit A